MTSRGKASVKYEPPKKPFVASCVAPERLYISDYAAAINFTALKEQRFTAVLTVGRILITNPPKPISYLFIEGADREQTDLLSSFPRAIEFIRASLASPGGKVLVHCGAGRSRSATALLSYLMAESSWDYDTALALLKTKRSMVQPNKGFERQLRLFHAMNYRIDQENPDYIAWHRASKPLAHPKPFSASASHRPQPQPSGRAMRQPAPASSLASPIKPRSAPPSHAKATTDAGASADPGHRAK